MTIRVDPADMGAIRVYFERRFLCRAMCVELSGEQVSLQELEVARKERRRYERGQLREGKAVVKRLGRAVPMDLQRGEEESKSGGVSEEEPKSFHKRYEHD